jgi:hypothetical protein
MDAENKDIIEELKQLQIEEERANEKIITYTQEHFKRMDYQKNKIKAIIERRAYLLKTKNK